MIDPGEKIQVDAPVSPINHVDNLSTNRRQLDARLLTIGFRLNSVIGTYRLNGVQPDPWIKATFEEIASGGPTSDIDARLHWNFLKAANTASAQL